MRTILIRTGLFGVLILAGAVRAHADVTVFVGAMTAGSPRPAIGVAVGRCPSIVGFEIEVARTGSATPTQSSVGGINANILVQSRYPAHGVQFYGTGGFGLYGETFDGGAGSGEVLAKNFGGGVKIKLAGPLRLRWDYRLFLLGDTPDAARGVTIHKHPQRLSVGLSVAF